VVFFGTSIIFGSFCFSSYMHSFSSSDYPFSVLFPFLSRFLFFACMLKLFQCLHGVRQGGLHFSLPSCVRFARAIW
jgi:hypothetical protein